MLAVETLHGQALDGVAGLGHALHLHAADGTHKEDVGLGIFRLDGIGNRDGGEDVTTRAATADDDSRLLVHALV